MAFDGISLSLIAKTISEETLGSRIEKVFVPSKDEVVLALRGKSGPKKLLLSASAMSARIQFTEANFENPQTPPMLCMLLRKYLNGARLAEVRQAELDRVLFLDWESRNELGDLVLYTLCIEIMGRHSNIILIGPDGKIMDSIKRIGMDVSSVRQVLPGMIYEMPPAQNKIDLRTSTVEEAIEGVKQYPEKEISKAVAQVLMGLSALPARELAYYASTVEVRVGELSEEGWGRLRVAFSYLKDILEGGEYFPTILLTPEGIPKDYTFLPIHSYPEPYSVRTFPTMEKLLDFFYVEKDRMERMRERSGALLKTLHNRLDRTERRVASQKQELLESQNREILKIQGDLLTANLYALEKGQEMAVVPNYYEEGSPLVEIPMNTRLTPVQNAQKYYTEYRKADTAEKKLRALILEGEAEYAYLESVYDALTRTSGETEFNEIRAELVSEGYLRNQRKNNKKDKKKLPPLEYKSTDGFQIFVGRNNHQNDELTLKTAQKNDIWFHVKEIPGSHTIIRTEGKEVPASTMEEAAMLAAWHSKARGTGNTAVDFTEVRNVKKPNGAKPGMVIYDPYETIYIAPDEEKIEVLSVRP